MMTNSKISKYNTMYKVIGDNSYFISYASASMAGGMMFGVFGAVAGIGVNALDDFLIYHHYTKDKIITQGFIGFTLGYNVYPSWVSGVITGCASVLLTQDILKDYHSGLSNLLSNAVLGVKVGGFPGALVGSALSAIDQILLYNNVTNKHYCSYSLLGVTSFSVVFGESVFSGSAGAVLGLVLADHANATSYFIRPIEIGKDLCKTYTRIVPQEQLDRYIKDYVIVLLSSQIVMNQFRVILLKHQQSSIYQFEHMDDSNSNHINKLTMVIMRFGLFVFPYVITEFLSEALNSFYSTKLYTQVDDSLRNLLFLNETALKISFDKNNAVLVDNLRSDSKIISRDGSKLIIDSITKSINGLSGVGILIVNVPELLVYSMLYNKGTEYVSTALAGLQNKYEILIKEQESIISSLFKHDMSNMKIITETGGVLYSYNQLQFAYESLRENELNKDQILHLVTAWRSFESYANFIYTYYLIGYKVGIGTINFDNRINMHYSCFQVSNFLAWNGEKSQEINAIYQSMERLNILLDKILSNTYTNIENIDNIKREQLINNKKLIISDLKLIVASKQLMRIDYLELEFGNRYAITGPSGSGKSSLITKIVGTTNNNIGGEGNIYYPQGVKIILINQQIYFPLNKKLKEVIFYPNSVSQEKIALVEELLIRIDLLQYKLDQIEDWYSVLSGGQKQKIKIISAIIQKPNVLILDEVFNGLDKNSIDLMQSIIIEKLPNTLIISIDHNALENSRADFYTNFLEVVGGELIDLQSKIIYQNKCNEYIDYDSFEKIISYDQQCHYYENDYSYC